MISEAISGGRLVQLVHAALLGRNGGARRRGGGGVGGAEGWRVVEEGATYFLLPPGNGLGFGRNSRLRLVVRLLSNTQHTHAQRNAYSRRPPPPRPPLLPTVGLSTPTRPPMRAGLWVRKIYIPLINKKNE